MYSKIVLPSVIGTFLSIFPLFNSNGKHIPFPARFPAWYPFDYKQPIIFDLIYDHQSIAVTILGFVNLNVDVLMANLMSYVAGECMVLVNCLEKLYKMTRNSK